MKHNTATTVFTFITLFFTITGMIGCDLFTVQAHDGARITIDAVPQQSLARAVAPDDTDIVIATYRLTGNGPNGATVDETETDGTFELEGLAVGTWTFTLTTLDNQDNPLSSGTTQATITKGTPQTASIQLSPVEGSGAVELDAEWAVGTDVDFVTATFTKAGSNAPQSYDFSAVIDTTASLSIPDIASGWYTVVIETTYSDAPTTIPSRTVSLVVYDGKTSRGTISLDTRQPMFKIANSWGIGSGDSAWENVPDGSYWMTAEAMKMVGLYAFFQGDLEAYRPTHIVKFQITGNERREDLSIGVSLYDASDNEIAWKAFSPYGLSSSMAVAALDPGHPLSAEPIAIDISEWADRLQADCTLELYIDCDSTTFGPGTVTDFRLEVYSDFPNAPDQTLVAPSLPEPIVNADYTYVDIPLTSLQVDAKARAIRKTSVLPASVVSRSTTDTEFARLVEDIGIREPGKNYNIVIDGHGTGFAPPTEQQWAALKTTLRTLGPGPGEKARGTYGNEVDLTEDPAFPPIGDQGQVGSCVAFSSTYYVKTYLEAKERGWDLSSTSWDDSVHAPSSNLDKIMSPAFVYNLANGGVDDGLYYTDAQQVLAEMGASSWQSMPYRGYDEDEEDDSEYAAWPEGGVLTQAMLNRATLNDEVGGISYYMSVDSDDAVDVLVRLIDAGYPITISVDAGQYSNLSSDDVWDENSLSDWNTNHANTIVGYRL